MVVLNIVLAVVFLVLSGFHFYWVFGGKLGYLAAVPEKFQVKERTRKGEVKTKIATLVVALGLLSLAMVAFLEIYYIFFWLILISRIFGSIFFIRAIGDFNILGIFKKKSASKFAYYDTRLYIPICLFVGAGLWMISYF